MTLKETIRMTVDVPASQHKRVKILSSILGISISDFIRESIEEKLNKKPNKLTQQVLKESELGKNIKTFNSLEDLFEDLGI